MLALVGATLTVFDLVLAAFRPARIADLGADTANVLQEPRIATHEGRSAPANRRTVPIQPNTFGHFFDVLLVQTRICTVLALLRAADTGLDTRLMFLMAHHDLWG
jgi:hypothetical protein